MVAWPNQVAYRPSAGAALPGPVAGVTSGIGPRGLRVLSTKTMSRTILRVGPDGTTVLGIGLWKLSPRNRGDLRTRSARSPFGSAPSEAGMSRRAQSPAVRAAAAASP
ncbi:hypothetical protein [Thermocatellispora tengchongensis]|uniref:hypothetical protein n=1 Tax=Thermocatellispora tengchongensis TaxID=1073253 RepID=UPI00363F0193